jgi:hypothetical protein
MEERQQQMRARVERQIGDFQAEGEREHARRRCESPSR